MQGGWSSTPLTISGSGLASIFSMRALEVRGVLWTSPSQGRRDPDSLRPALSLGGQATAWECSPGRSLCLTKSSVKAKVSHSRARLRISDLDASRGTTQAPTSLNKRSKTLHPCAATSPSSPGHVNHSSEQLRSKPSLGANNTTLQNSGGLF